MQPRRALAAALIAFLCRLSGAFRRSRQTYGRVASTGPSVASYCLTMSTSSTTAPGLRSFVDGKDDGPTVVFVHGWPDDHTLWDMQVDHLKDRFRCVTTDLPGFSGDDANTERWGYSVDECVRRLETTIEAEGNGEPVILVAHDWGCAYAFMLEARRPELMHKIVAIDVGGDMRLGPVTLICIMSYHVWLAAAFLLGGPVGDFMARSFAWLVGAPAWNRVARGAVCYPYYRWWEKIFRGDEVKVMMPHCPLLFLYGCIGGKKILTFHTNSWVEKVNKKEGSSAVAMTLSSHWVTKDQPVDVNRRIDAFLTD